MRYLKLFEDITYTSDKLSEIVSNAEENLRKSTEYIKKYASMICSVTLYDVSQDINKYKDIIKKLEFNIDILEREIEKNANVVDMYPVVISERPIGTHDLISKLEYTINSKLDSNKMELSEIKEFIDHLVYFSEHQNNNEIIKSIIKS